MPDPAVGARSLFGMAEEPSYAAVTAPSRWIEFLAGESLQRRENFYQPQGIGGGGARNLRAGAKRVSTHRDAGGTIAFEVATRSFGLLFKHLIGGTPTVVQQGVTAAYLQTYALGTVADRSLTLQKQFRDPAGNVILAMTYPGSILTRGTFSITPGDPLLRLEVEVDARDEDTSVAAGAASFVDSTGYRYREGVLTLGGTAVANVGDTSITLTNPMVVDRYRFGNAGLKARPIDADFPAVTGALTADFESAALYNDFKNNTARELKLVFTGAVIEGTNNEKLEFTLPEVRFSGASPTVSDTGLTTQPMEFGGWKNPAGAAGFQLAWTTRDAAV